MSQGRRHGRGRARNRARARTELVLPWGRCTARRAGEVRPGEASPKGLGGYQIQRAKLWANLDGQPGAVGGEAARGEMVEPHAVLEVYGISTGVGRPPVQSRSVMDSCSWPGNRAFHPAYDEPHRRGVWEGSVTSAAPSIQRDGRPVLLGYGSMILRRLWCRRNGDGEADLRLATDGHHVMGVEAAVNRDRPTVSRRKFPTLPQPGHQHVASASGHGQQRVVAALASVAVVARPLLRQPVGLAG